MQIGFYDADHHPGRFFAELLVSSAGVFITGRTRVADGATASHVSGFSKLRKLYA
jgi:hypothetical protein